MKFEIQVTTQQNRRFTREIVAKMDNFIFPEQIIFHALCRVSSDPQVDSQLQQNEFITNYINKYFKEKHSNIKYTIIPHFYVESTKTMGDNVKHVINKVYEQNQQYRKKSENKLSILACLNISRLLRNYDDYPTLQKFLYNEQFDQYNILLVDKQSEENKKNAVVPQYDHPVDTKKGFYKIKEILSKNYNIDTDNFTYRVLWEDNNITNEPYSNLWNITEMIRDYKVKALSLPEKQRKEHNHLFPDWDILTNDTDLRLEVCAIKGYIEAIKVQAVLNAQQMRHAQELEKQKGQLANDEKNQVYQILDTMVNNGCTKSHLLSYLSKKQKISTARQILITYLKQKKVSPSRSRSLSDDFDKMAIESPAVPQKNNQTIDDEKRVTRNQGRRPSNLSNASGKSNESNTPKTKGVTKKIKKQVTQSEKTTKSSNNDNDKNSGNNSDDNSNDMQTQIQKMQQQMLLQMQQLQRLTEVIGSKQSKKKTPQKETNKKDDSDSSDDSFIFN